jgi:hypothetical protein
MMASADPSDALQLSRKSSRHVDNRDAEAACRIHRLDRRVGSIRLVVKTAIRARNVTVGSTGEWGMKTEPVI